MPRRLPMLLLTALLAAGTVPPGHAAEDGRQLLERTAERYRNARTIHIAGEINAVLDSPDGKQTTEARFLLLATPGGRVRDELIHPGSGSSRVSDGVTTWQYFSQLRQYTEQKLVAASPTEPGGDVKQGMAGVLLVPYRALGDGVDTMRSLPDESIPFGGGKRRCAVIEIRFRPGAVGAASQFPRTLWIDRERHLVLRQRSVVPMSQHGEGATQTETFHFTRMEVDGAVHDSLFTFRPPAGAAKVAQFGRGNRQQEDLSGKMASDFTLTDLDGRSHRLADQKGKVVLLDFWASWCGPCRIQMPNVEKLHREFKDKGLVVYAINEGEGAEKARGYIQKNGYTTTTLLDQRQDIGRAYKASGIPTLVIIDREGKIVAHYIGVRQEDVLRDALKRAGLE